MIPVSLDQMLTVDPVAGLQAAIVTTVKTLLTGVTVAKHPGKVDLSELVAKTVVPAPGIGIGWSRIRTAGMADGSYGLAVEWVAYIVAEARVVGMKRVEKEVVGIAIGTRLLAILSDNEASFWGRAALMPVSETPAPELKPLFTVKDASQGTAYYTVTWTQVLPDVGHTYFPQHKGTVDAENGSINYDDPAWIDAITPFLAGEVVDDA
ncbi:hypothetical protein KYK30_20560 [Shinella yambaruensis]|uniref:Uncharacterized protein n=1 Tax=Shinella yambaruensis TaxID=415996 RepID=A0ABQ5ZI33_9HYPH|nr:hypothetical protein [Shinella yambaruensis]MCJ8027012.1 hypothetical protein [Shinella yambaruensis]MCU7982096.1 hypothetical protein [Shinella yambaruensis]GLR51271.1 hypothetical protein GCM10007923_24790 [Shinella yambaruensis]